MSEQIFSGPFRFWYLSVKTLALYAGGFMLCYYWPLFLSAVLVPGEVTGALFGALLAPLGLLILGATGGLRAGLAHVLLVVVGCAAAYVSLQMIGEPTDDPEIVLGTWTNVMMLIYAAGYVVGLRTQLRRHQPLEV